MDTIEHAIMSVHKLNADEKDITIGVMEKLLSFGRTLPFFCVTFNISAKNEDIEQWLLSKMDRCDWDGKSFDDEEVKKAEADEIDRFRSSEYYGSDGESEITVQRFFFVTQISFENIYKLVKGKDDGLPKGYRYAGDLKLLKFDEEL